VAFFPFARSRGPPPPPTETALFFLPYTPTIVCRIRNRSFFRKKSASFFFFFFHALPLIPTDVTPPSFLPCRDSGLLLFPLKGDPSPSQRLSARFSPLLSPNGFDFFLPQNGQSFPHVTSTFFSPAQKETPPVSPMTRWARRICNVTQFPLPGESFLPSV